jgi:hypothetical protein
MSRHTFRQAVLRSVACALACSLFAAAAVACPKSPGPDLSEVDISSDMTVNGLPVQIRQVSSKDSAKDVLDKLEKAWRDDTDFKVKRNKAGPWDVLSALSPQCMTTVQLRDEGGSIGFFAIGKPQQARRAALYDIGFPLPSGAHVVSDVATRTDERPARTVVLTSNESPDSLSERIGEALNESGWKDLRSHQVQAPGGLENQVARRITAKRGEDLVSIVVWSAKQTTAVVSLGQAL